MLYQPYNCDRDVYDLMLECWEKHTEDRPDFQVSSHEAFCPLFKYYLPGNITFSHAEEPWLRPVLWLNKLHLISPFFQNLCLMKVYIENLVRKYTLYPFISQSRTIHHLTSFYKATLKLRVQNARFNITEKGLPYGTWESRCGHSMFRSCDNEAGWVTGGGDGVAAGVVCRGTSSGIPDTRALNYFSMTNS